MPGWKIAVLVVVFVSIDLMVVCGILWAIGRSIRELSDKFPPVPPSADAVRRNFESIHLGLIGLGGSVHLTVDATHLHLDPAWFARRIGVRSLSIPLDAIRVKQRGRFRTSAEIGGTTLTAPNWCMDLVNPPEA